MHGDTTRGSPTDRVWTAFVPRRSELRRRSDRLETAAHWVVLTALVLALPVVLALGSSHAQDLRDAAAAQRRVDHEVAATVIAVRPLESSARGEGSGLVEVTAGWSEPDGSVRTDVDVRSGDVRVGEPRSMWVDQSGHRVRPPTTDADAATRGYLAAAGLLAACSALLGGLLWMVRRRLDRARLREWDEDWLAFRRGRDRGVTG